MRIEELLPLLNEWWQRGVISNDKAKTYKRIYFENLSSLLDERQIVIVTGLRRVGKSTLLYQAIDKLLSAGTNPLNILYFTFDESVDEIHEVLKEYRRLTDTNWKEERIYVFLDEIQKHPGWSSEVKLLYDNFPKIKFIISGSASLNMEIDAIKDLAGRYFFIDMLPLFLKEFAEMYMDRKIEKPAIFRDELDFLLPKFTRRPFPEIIKWEDESKILEYIRSLVIEKVIYTDLPQIVKDFRPELANGLLRIFMNEVGMILNVDAMSRDIKVSKSVLNEHIHYLEFARLIKVVRNFRPSIMAESRKMKRIYPYHISLTTPFKYTIEEGKVFESQTRTYLKLKHYWRKDKKEVDFLKIERNEIIPIEVKSGKNIKPKMYKTLKEFMHENNVSEGVLIYGGTESHTEALDEEYKISVIPMNKILWDGNYLPVSK